MTERLLYAALSWNDSIGPKRYRKIIETCGSVEKFFDLSVKEQMSAAGVKDAEAEKRFEAMKDEGAKVLERCDKLGIRMIAETDPEYLPKLKNIPDAPFAYYLKGDFNYSAPLLAVVGTRLVSSEAEEINRYFSGEIASYSVGIVSGMALGHDAVAQSAALDRDGFTVAVLGCGIDVVYPKENEGLYRRIEEKGAFVSEYAPGVEPAKWRFPLRNRIISGISDAVLLIQAPARSGALITCLYAEEQKRNVYVVPGNPIDERYAGSNRLIQKGALIALKPEDVVFDLCGKQPAKKQTLPEELDLDPEQKKVLELLSNETYIDDLVERSGIPVVRMNSLLTHLELLGLVTQYPGRFYARKTL